MSKKHYIYIHANKINHKIYVGQTINIQERWSRKGYRYKDSPRFYAAIQKYGWDNFNHIILEKCFSEKDANEYEKYWIKVFKSNKEQYGYNLTPGGDNYMVDLWSDSAFRQRMSESFSKAKKEKWKNLEFQNEMINKLTEGTKAAWANADWREKRIQNLIGHNNPNSKAVQNIETKKIFMTIKEASQWCGLKSISCIGQNCKGIKKSAGKHPITKVPLHWKFITNLEVVNVESVDG